MSERCEPPEGWRYRFGVHWIVRRVEGRGDLTPILMEWEIHGGVGEWRYSEICAEAGWRYLSPVATPAEVAALRRERDEARAEASEWCQKVQLFEDVAHRRKNERDAIGIAFTKLSAVLRVNMLRHVPGTSHAEIDAAIDACLGPVARAALALADGENVALGDASTSTRVSTRDPGAFRCAAAIRAMKEPGA
jgi:hypothetical protein